MPQKPIFRQVFLLVSVLISFAYIGVGVLFLVSKNIQEVMPSYNLAIILGIGCIVYGIFRVWRSFNKFKTEDSE